VRKVRNNYAFVRGKNPTVNMDVCDELSRAFEHHVGR